MTLQDGRLFFCIFSPTSRAAHFNAGVTNDLVRRVHEHREGIVPGFTKRHGLKQLVHFERYDDATTAIQREKNVKHWSRVWKLDLIASANPQWRDLYTDITRSIASWMPGSSPGMMPRMWRALC
jgi:putative endonuclease